MADSLDDFFAKKDKKKSKKNYLVPEELVQQIVENGKGRDRKKRDKDKSGSGVASVIPKLLDQIKNDEEWNDFEDEKEKDYRGLKIQTLNLREEEERELMKEMSGDKKDEPGPWKVSKDPSPNQPSPTEPKSEEPKKVNESDEKKDTFEKESSLNKNEKDAETQPKRYIPPHARRNADAMTRDYNSSQSYSIGLAPIQAAALRKKSHIPQINDESDFPSL